MTAQQQPDDAPAASGLFRDIMATFGSPSFRMPCPPAAEEEDTAECDVDGDDVQAVQ